ncbi:MAG: methionyl-tRNA formyltransferase [Candidatus Omnitrophica bacterium]|nr:methionyl-tRNA formyltransferase [Candidatus Omnitrophota bacterium]
MKIIFFGSDDFAAENLMRLLEEKFAVAACVTQPDRPSGRGLQVIASPIKIIARDRNIPILQPEKLRDEDFLKRIKSFGADLFVVIAYGQILPSLVLKMPKIFCINVHGSLLPKYRGAAPVNWAVINGDKETGFTIMKMSPKMDAGEIIVQEKLNIDDDETSESLRTRMAKASAVRLCKVVKDIGAGKFTLTPQDESKVTFAAKLTKELGKINWNKSAQEIHDLVRGLLPWPGAFTSCNGKVLKILQTKVAKVGTDTYLSVPGTISQINKDGILVATGKGSLLLQFVHPESSKLIPAHALASGQRLQVGMLLGSS